MPVSNKTPPNPIGWSDWNIFGTTDFDLFPYEKAKSYLKMDRKVKKSIKNNSRVSKVLFDADP